VLEVSPDLTAFGKVIGGGMPVGAIAGPARVMQSLSPAGDVYQAGTLSGNPLAMAAGLATLELISAPGFFDALGKQCSRLVDGLVAAAADAGVPFSARSLGGMAGMYFRDQAPDSFADVQQCDTAQFSKFFHAMLDGGVSLPPSAYEAFFFSSAHSDADIDQTVAVARQAFQSVA
jgi:glutamate-1-semialdehyde 2,1-aminomutase